MRKFVFFVLLSFAMLVVIPASGSADEGRQVLTDRGSEETLAIGLPALAGHLDASLVRISEWVEETESFAREQMPLLVKEVLLYRIVLSGSGIGLSLLLVLWAAFAYYWSQHNAEVRMARIEAHTQVLKDLSNSCDETADVAFSFKHYGVPVSGGAAAVVGIIVFFANIMGLVKPLIAPRLYLVEYFRQLAG